MITKAIEVTHYYTNQEFVLSTNIKIKLFGITIKTIPLLNMPDTLTEGMKSTLYDLCKANLENAIQEKPTMNTK